MKSQKLSIYLLKDNITDHGNLVKDVNTKEIFGDGVLYYKKSFSKEPAWTDNFFNKSIDALKNSTASGLYITKIKHNKDIYFGISFGHGWQMLKDGVIVEQFGIKTALSIIKDEIREIKKKNFKHGLKDVSEQLGKVGTVADFGFDVEQDIMRAIAGEAENKALYGKNVVGKDALSLSVKKNVDEIGNLLKEIYKAYISNDYKKRFDWFDNFLSISDKRLVSELDTKIADNIRDDTKSDVIYWLAIPDIISWENTKCFKYSQRSSSIEYQDITFDDFKISLGSDHPNISIELLKKKKVSQVDTNDNIIEEWPIYKCVYAEIDYNNEKYLLVAGKYYKVDKDYKKKVEDDVVVDTTFSLPDWDKSKHENVYNIEVATNDNSFQCLDGGASQSNLIGKGKIEFADLVKTDKHLVHVKKYGASAVLSHLFSQGFVSATLLLTEKPFRTEVNTKLATLHKSIVTDSKPNPSEFTIVYAIGTNKDDLKLPFFSLVNYRNTKKQLELYGYKVCMIKIKQI